MSVNAMFIKNYNSDMFHAHKIDNITIITNKSSTTQKLNLENLLIKQTQNTRIIDNIPCFVGWQRLLE